MNVITSSDNRPLRSDGLISLVALGLAFAAFDDITTDNASSFRVEYSVLIACAAWFAFLAARLIRRRCRTLGVVSLVALTGATWAQQAIGQGITPAPWAEYFFLVGTFFWFLAIAIWLVAFGARHDLLFGSS
jgi:hypothetical protein